MPQSLLRHRSFVAWSMSTLWACNALLGNEPAELLDAGAPSTDAAIALDAAADASPPPGLDAATADAGPLEPCQKLAAPTHSCFDGGSCTIYERAVERPVSTGLPKAYPHGLALWNGYLYFSAQVWSPDGRNDNGTGELYRLRTSMLDAAMPVTAFDGLSASAVHVRDGFLFWRTWNAATSRSAIHRLELSAWPGTTPCKEAACGYESVAADIDGRVTELWAASPTRLYARLDGGLRRFVREGEAWLARPLTPVLAGARGRMRDGLFASWSPGTEATDGRMTLYSLSAGGEPAARVSWTTPPEGTSPIPFESSRLSVSCEDTFVYEQWATPSLHRIDLDAGVDAGPEQVRTPIPCPTCTPALTFAHATDARFSYMGQPNAGGVLAVEHTSGIAHKLVTGDVWDVLVDDDAVFFTNIDGSSIGRIEKR